MVMIIKRGKQHCTGCGVCFLRCPNNCISFVPDRTGFYYPEIDVSTCSRCGICQLVCPSNIHSDLPKNTIPDKSYAAWHCDLDILERSSSGGAFFGIIQSFEGCDLFVGACYDKDLKVVHRLVRGKGSVNIFFKSKYAQSELGDVFLQIESALKSGEKVVFSGLPCQIAGLKSFLHKKYDGLLCVEILCHGVASPGVFASYLKYIEKKFAKSIVGYDFRWKSGNSGWKDFFVELKFQDGENLVLKDDLFMRGYLEGLFHRESCLSCEYMSKERLGDILLGDFWGVEKFDPSLFSPAGVSLVIPITKLGFEVLKNLYSHMKVFEVPMDFAIKGNPVLTRQANIGKFRQKFFEKFEKNLVENAIYNCLESNSCLNRLKKFLVKIRNKI